MAMSVGTSDNESKSNNTINNSTNKNRSMGKRAGKRPGRKPAKIDERAKLERSRQSAKECRARKKLRYQYLEELVLNREKAVFTLREELEMFKQWCIQLDRGNLPDTLVKMIANEEVAKERRQAEELKRAAEVQGQRRQEDQLTASTSSARVFSSSPKSSPSPPHSSGDSSYSMPQQHSKQVQSRLPPPYSDVSRTPQRFALTRQMAFDQGGQFHPNQPTPQHEQNVTLSTSVLPEHHNIHHRHQPPTTSSSRVCPATQQGTFNVMYSNSHDVCAPSYAQNQQQKQSLPQQQVTHGNISTPSNQEQMNYSRQLQSPKEQQQQQQQLNMFGFPHHQPLQTTNQTYSITNVKNESPVPVGHQTSLEDISDFISRDTKRNLIGQFTSRSDNVGNEMASTPPFSGSRVRSLSNPVAMSSLNRQQHEARQGDFITGSSHQTAHVSSIRDRDSHAIIAAYQKTHPAMNTSTSIGIMSPSTSHDCVKNEMGLFSGISLACNNSSSAITVEDSDSSDENTNISHLFQSSSVTSQKRALVDANIHRQNKKARSLDSEMDMLGLWTADSILSLFNEADQSSPVKVNNLTTVNCPGSTETLNAQSPSPFSLVPRNTDSPMTTSSRVTSPSPSTQSSTITTPSSSTNPSPAPLSSFLENPATSSTYPSAIMESDIEMSIPSTPTIENFLLSSSLHETPFPIICSETGLSATISEPIPEWYSFLADLQVENSSPIQPALDSRRRQSRPQTHILQAQNQEQDQSSSMFNVPSIIEELSSSDDCT